MNLATPQHNQERVRIVAGLFGDAGAAGRALDAAQGLGLAREAVEVLRDEAGIREAAGAAGIPGDHARAYRSGVREGGAVLIAKPLTDEEAEALERSWREIHGELVYR